MMLSLPAELQDAVFKLLPNRQDIASCRLVCREFLAYSTPYLDPRIVISKRLDSLKQIPRLLRYPALHIHVKELVWDCSSYLPRLGADFENYIEACVSNPSREFRDPRSIDEDAEYAALCNDVALEREPLPWEELHLANMGVYEDNHMYATGMHRGYDDYFRRVKYQERVEQDGVHLHLLRLALRRFERLQCIVIGDFTDLTLTEHEDYNDLCVRLFGNTLEPASLSREDVEFEHQDIECILREEGRQNVLIDLREDEQDDSPDEWRRWR